MCQRCSADILHCQEGRNTVGGVCGEADSNRINENKQKQRARKEDRKKKKKKKNLTETPHRLAFSLSSRTGIVDRSAKVWLAVHRGPRLQQ